MKKLFLALFIQTSFLTSPTISANPFGTLVALPGSICHSILDSMHIGKIAAGLLIASYASKFLSCYPHPLSPKDQEENTKTQSISFVLKARSNRNYFTLFFLEHTPFILSHLSSITVAVYVYKYITPSLSK